MLYLYIIIFIIIFYFIYNINKRINNIEFEFKRIQIDPIIKDKKNDAIYDIPSNTMNLIKRKKEKESKELNH